MVKNWLINVKYPLLQHTDAKMAITVLREIIQIHGCCIHFTEMQRFEKGYLRSI